MACGAKRNGETEKGTGRMGKLKIGKTKMILGYRFHH